MARLNRPPEIIHALIGQVDTLSAIVDDLSILTLLTGSIAPFDCVSVDLADIADGVITSMTPDLIYA